MTTKHWRYEVPAAPGRDRAIVFLDSEGTFVSASAYGIIGDRYNAFGNQDFRAFVLGLEGQRAIDNFAHGRDVYDDETTLANVKALIGRHFDSGRISHHIAGRMADDIEDEYGNFGDQNDFDWWLRDGLHLDKLDIDERYGCLARKSEPNIVAFVEKVLPVLQEMLRAELEAERLVFRECGGRVTVKYWWLSWWQPGDDCRPLSSPPNEAVIGWWISGERDNESSICLVVAGADEFEAKRMVAIDWPESVGSEWRFCQERDMRKPMSDRFPLSEWMLERFAKVASLGGKETKE